MMSGQRTVAKSILVANWEDGWSHFGFLRWFLLCIFLVTDLGLWVLILRKDQGGVLHVYFILVSSPFLWMVIGQHGSRWNQIVG